MGSKFNIFLNESQSVSQSLKSIPKKEVLLLKKQAEEDIKNDFKFEIKLEEKKLTDLINWYSLQLSKGMTREDVQFFKDYLIEKIDKLNLRDSSYNFQEAIKEAEKWNSISSELKKIPEKDLKLLKNKSESLIDYYFNFDMQKNKKNDLINWYAFQLHKGMRENEAINFRDYFAGNLNLINLKDSSYDFYDAIRDSQDWHQELKQNRKIGVPGRLGKQIITFNDGWFWVRLNKPSCDLEGSSMGHCGNAGFSEGDEIFSLRSPDNIPYLTFIVNNKILGESKGRFNAKPERRFHKYIVQLLVSDYINSISGGGYAPENNFELQDLSKNLYNYVIQRKPDINNILKTFYLKKDEIIINHSNTGYGYSASSYIIDNGNYKKIFDLSDQDYLNIALYYLSHSHIYINDKYIDYDYDEKNKLIKNIYNNNIYNKKSYYKNITFNQFSKELIDEALYVLNIKNNIFSYYFKIEKFKSLSKEDISNIINVINLGSYYNGDINNIKKFLKYLKIEYPKYFSDIYYNINKKLRSGYIFYFIITDTFVTDKELLDLNDEDLSRLINFSEENNIPIKNNLLILKQKRQAYNSQSIDNISMAETSLINLKVFFTEIIYKINNNIDISFEERKLFNKNFLLNIEEFRKFFILNKNFLLSNEKITYYYDNDFIDFNFVVQVIKDREEFTKYSNIVKFLMPLFTYGITKNNIFLHFNYYYIYLDLIYKFATQNISKNQKLYNNMKTIFSSIIIERIRNYIDNNRVKDVNFINDKINGKSFIFKNEIEEIVMKIFKDTRSYDNNLYYDKECIYLINYFDISYMDMTNLAIKISKY